MLLDFFHLDELLPNPACRIYQLVKAFELHRVLRLLIVRLLTRLGKKRKGNETFTGRIHFKETLQNMGNSRTVVCVLLNICIVKKYIGEEIKFGDSEDAVI